MSRHNVITTFLSVAACKLCRTALRVMKRGGTTLPGRAALFFDKKILEVVSSDMEIIVVTGTNGKTTTCGLLRQALHSAGIDVLSNRSGANLLTGITAEFTCNAGPLGHAKKHYAIIECDEGALKRVVPLIHPKVILVTNLFRDQLDRYGEVMHTLSAIREGVSLVPESILCLNADCSLTSSLAGDVPNKVVYYGIDTATGDDNADQLSDAKYCIKCGTEYKYNFHTYAHLGDFYCPECGYKRVTPDVAVTAIKSLTAKGTSVSLRYKDNKGSEVEKDVRIGLPALYNVYNALAAISAFKTAGFNIKYILRSLTKVNSSFGRMETFNYKNTDIQMILVKNPAGCNQALSYLASLSQDYVAVFCLNDKTADGHDISWIWDADYEKVCRDENCKKIYVTGTRGEDMQLRLKYADVPEDKIILKPDDNSLIDAFTETGLPVFVLPNYTSMLSLRHVLGELSGKSEFWKG